MKNQLKTNDWTRGEMKIQSKKLKAGRDLIKNSKHTPKRQ
jgi:hypothetical protein